MTMLRLFKPNVEKIDKENNIQGLIKCLKHWSSDTRYDAFNALAKRINDYDVAKALRDLINDSDPRVKASAILTFAQAGEEEMFDNIRTILLDGSTRDKIEALRIISVHGATNNPSILNMVVLALNDGKIAIRTRALKAMGHIKNRHFIPYLTQSLHDMKQQVRMEAVKALGMMGGEDVVDALISALMDSNQEVIRTAKAALTAIGTSKALKAIKDEPFMLLMKGMSGPLETRIETVRHIAKTLKKEGLPLLHKACNDKYKELRLEALKALEVFQDQSSVQVIANLLQDKFSDVRQEAVNALAKIPVKASIEALQKTIESEKSHSILEAAKTTAEEIKKMLKIT